MLDSSGYRLNVGIVIANGQGGVLWAKRMRQGGWQFPQGGMQHGETPKQAMYRELHEEVGLEAHDVEVWGVTRSWLRYRLPEKMVRQVKSGTTCIGQKQKWFLLHLTSPESAINTAHNAKPEFSDWRWVSYWYPVNQIIDFKRWVYKRALKELSVSHAEKMRRLQAPPR
ncbi:MAG: RNA pyrophosphohydrolase [Pseudomonadales bacterium]|nr:RNA pyrophosphohydrolase [Gammaproteobacteria bacterium]NNL57582.1 RNA pyrophosphohydrolase [Pseudomonadales bacterium]